MKSSTFSYLPLAGAMLLVSTAAFAASRGTLNIPEQVFANGQSLSAGEYQVRWDGEGPNVELKILHDRKLVTTIPARTIELRQKAEDDSFSINKNGDGTESVSEIQFSGKKYAFIIGEQSQENSGSASSK